MPCIPCIIVNVSFCFVLVFVVFVFFGGVACVVFIIVDQRCVRSFYIIISVIEDEHEQQPK